LQTLSKTKVFVSKYLLSIFFSENRKHIFNKNNRNSSFSDPKAAQLNGQLHHTIPFRQRCSGTSQPTEPAELPPTATSNTTLARDSKKSKIGNIV
jgi:hypothetical protein